MRTFNGLQIFTEQLTNSGQLDLRYVRITGNDNGANLIFGDNIQSNYSFYKNTNFNIQNSTNIFYSNDGNAYTGYLPDIKDKTTIYIKNLYSSQVLTVTGYNSQQGFDMADEVIDIPAPQCIHLLGVKNNTYTGWVNLNSTAGIS